MKTLEIKIKSREQAEAEFIEVFKAVQAGKKLPTAKKTEVYFTDLEAVRALLTDKRLELLHLIRKHSPRSINQLATIAGRDFKNVHTDIMLLKDYGLVQLSKRGKTTKTAGRAISVPYQAINIHAVV
jgi:predicted transcriptional regulator